MTHRHVIFLIAFLFTFTLSAIMPTLVHADDDTADTTNDEPERNIAEMLVERKERAAAAKASMEAVLRDTKYGENKAKNRGLDRADKEVTTIPLPLNIKGAEHRADIVLSYLATKSVKDTIGNDMYKTLRDDVTRIQSFFDTMPQHKLEDPNDKFGIQPAFYNYYRGIVENYRTALTLTVNKTYRDSLQETIDAAKKREQKYPGNACVRTGMTKDVNVIPVSIDLLHDDVGWLEDNIDPLSPEFSHLTSAVNKMNRFDADCGITKVQDETNGCHQEYLDIRTKAVTAYGLYVRGCNIEFSKAKIAIIKADTKLDSALSAVNAALISAETVVTDDNTLKKTREGIGQYKSDIGAWKRDPCHKYDAFNSITCQGQLKKLLRSGEDYVTELSAVESTLRERKQKDAAKAQAKAARKQKKQGDRGHSLRRRSGDSKSGPPSGNTQSLEDTIQNAIIEAVTRTGEARDAEGHALDLGFLGLLGDAASPLGETFLASDSFPETLEDAQARVLANLNYYAINGKTSSDEMVINGYLIDMINNCGAAEIKGDTNCKVKYYMIVFKTARSYTTLLKTQIAAAGRGEIAFNADGSVKRDPDTSSGSAGQGSGIATATHLEITLEETDTGSTVYITPGSEGDCVESIPSGRDAVVISCYETTLGTVPSLPVANGKPFTVIKTSEGEDEGETFVDVDISFLKGTKHTFVDDKSGNPRVLVVTASVPVPPSSSGSSGGAVASNDTGSGSQQSGSGTTTSGGGNSGSSANSSSSSGNSGGSGSSSGRTDPEDPDGDMLYGSVDACPNKPEDWVRGNKIEKADGCPILGVISNINIKRTSSDNMIVELTGDIPFLGMEKTQSAHNTISVTLFYTSKGILPDRLQVHDTTIKEITVEEVKNGVDTMLTFHLHGTRQMTDFAINSRGKRLSIEVNKIDDGSGNAVAGGSSPGGTSTSGTASGNTGGTSGTASGNTQSTSGQSSAANTGSGNTAGQMRQSRSSTTTITPGGTLVVERANVQELETFLKRNPLLGMKTEGRIRKAIAEKRKPSTTSLIAGNTYQHEIEPVDGVRFMRQCLADPSAWQRELESSEDYDDTTSKLRLQGKLLLFDMDDDLTALRSAGIDSAPLEATISALEAETGATAEANSRQRALKLGSIRAMGSSPATNKESCSTLYWYIESERMAAATITATLRHAIEMKSIVDLSLDRPDPKDDLLRRAGLERRVAIRP